MERLCSELVSELPVWIASLVEQELISMYIQSVRELLSFDTGTLMEALRHLLSLLKNLKEVRRPQENL